MMMTMMMTMTKVCIGLSRVAYMCWKCR